MHNPKPRVMVESLERRTHLDASQLSESIVSSTLAASASDESAIKGTVVVDVANTAGFAQKFKAKIELLGGENLLTAKGTTISLAAGASKEFSLGVAVGKKKLPDGEYDLVAEVIQPTGVSSRSAVGATLIVRPPIVDLSETEIFRKLVTTVAPFTKFSTTDIVSITNSGSDPSSDPIVVNVYASTDGTIVGATSLGTIRRKITIKAGATAVVSIGIKIKAGLPAGTYQLISAVTQANATVTNTNPVTAPVLDVPAPVTVPKFVETLLTATPLYVTGTQTVDEIDIQLAIENKGTGVDASSQYALYLSTSPTFDSTATLIASLPLTQLLPGSDASKSFQVDFGVPNPSPLVFNGSNYYVYVQVTDPDGAVSMGSLSTPIVIN